MTSKSLPLFQPSLAFPRASSGHAGPPSPVPSHPRENPDAVHNEHAQTPAPASDDTSGSGGEGTPGRFVSRLLAERRSHGHGLPAPSSAVRLAPSVLPPDPGPEPGPVPPPVTEPGGRPVTPAPETSFDSLPLDIARIQRSADILVLPAELPPEPECDSDSSHALCNAFLLSR